MTEEHEEAEISELPDIPEESEILSEEIEEGIEHMNDTVANKTVEKRDTSGQVLDLLQFDDAYLIYDICRYERARNPDDVSVWCAVFEEEDLMVKYSTLVSRISVLPE